MQGNYLESEPNPKFEKEAVHTFETLYHSIIQLIQSSIISEVSGGWTAS